MARCRVIIRDAARSLDVRSRYLSNSPLFDVAQRFFAYNEMFSF